MLTIVRSNRFLKDLRLAKKRGLDLSSFPPLFSTIDKSQLKFSSFNSTATKCVFVIAYTAILEQKYG